MPPPVLFIGTYLETRQGSRAVSEDLALQLEASGWVTTCTSRVHSRPGRLGDMLHSVWTERKQFAVAVVDVHSGPAFAYAEAASWWLRRLRKPYVLTLHGGQLPEFAHRYPERVRRLLASAHAVTAPSRYLQETMRPYHSAIRMIPNPLDIRRYPYRVRAVAAPKLAWLRAFHLIYDPLLAIDVVDRLRRDFPNLTLQMAGPDKDGSLSEVQAAINRRDVGAYVTVAGAIPKTQVPVFLDHSDVFLNTTTADNTPVSVIEAMACGLCVVTTHVGGIPYLLDHGKDSLLVPAGDATAMTAAVAALLTSPALAERLSRSARRKAEAFDWSIVLPQWTDLLEHVSSTCEAA